jgi:tRNA uridine 5-carbamoylmethylation protein Kti12
MKIYAITGKSCTGKTTLAQHLASTGQYETVYTDSYIKYGDARYSVIMQEIQEQLRTSKKPWLLVEGIDVPKLIQLGLKPDKFRLMTAEDYIRDARHEARNTKRNAGLDSYFDNCYADMPQQES